MIQNALLRKLTIEHTRTPLITGVNPGSPENKQFPFYYCRQSYSSCYEPGDGMNDERTGLSLQLPEHVRGHF